MTTMPMTTQKPLASAPLLTSASSLIFRATSRDRSGSTLGVLVDAAGAQHHLTIIPSPGAVDGADGADGTWTLSSGALPLGKKPVLLHESAANVLRGGAPNADGTISYQGGSYVIESFFDGRAWTAKVSGST